MTTPDLSHQEEINQEFKNCTRCCIKKPLSEFHRDKSKPSGYRSRCKVCIAEYDKDPKRLEKRRLHMRIWYKKNTECAKLKLYKWREKNPKCHAIIVKNWRINHPEQSRMTTKRYKENNPDKVMQFRHTRRAKIKAAGGSFTGDSWAKLKKDYEYRCLACCRAEPEIILAPDHIVPISRGGTNNIENIQPLCRECNSKKHTRIVDYRIKFFNVDRDVEKELV